MRVTRMLPLCAIAALSVSCVSVSPGTPQRFDHDLSRLLTEVTALGHLVESISERGIILFNDTSACVPQPKPNDPQPPSPLARGTAALNQLQLAMGRGTKLPIVTGHCRPV